MRAAIYYAPARDDALAIAAATWLGRDPETGALYRQPDLPDMRQITADAALYGFHATLKPPMRLNGHWNDFLAAARALAARLAPFDLPELAVADLNGFLALRETSPCPALRALADACVTELDAFRLPPDADELKKRRGAGLPPREDALLQRWGYPYVFETWFFHMTLTRRLNAEQCAIFRPAAEAHFAPALSTPRRVNDICVFVQPAPGRPFTIAERIPLRG
jgi:putative phosphonate metabolism protein